MKEVLRAGRSGLTAIAWARAQLYTASADMRRRWSAPSRQASPRRAAFLFSTWGLVELIEAAAEAENVSARRRLERLTKSTRACGTDWAARRRGALTSAAERRRGCRSPLP